MLVLRQEPLIVWHVSGAHHHRASDHHQDQTRPIPASSQARTPPTYMAPVTAGQSNDRDGRCTAWRRLSCRRPGRGPGEQSRQQGRQAARLFGKVLQGQGPDAILTCRQSGFELSWRDQGCRAGRGSSGTTKRGEQRKRLAWQALPGLFAKGHRDWQLDARKQPRNPRPIPLWRFLTSSSSMLALVCSVLEVTVRPVRIRRSAGPN